MVAWGLTSMHEALESMARKTHTKKRGDDAKKSIFKTLMGWRDSSVVKSGYYSKR